MTFTATQLIYQALRDLGALRPGQTSAGDLNNDGLVALNQMIDSWLLDELMVFADVGSIYNLVAGTQTYTIGPSGAAFTAPRPTRIDDANLILNNVTPNVRLPISVIDVDQWADIRVQSIPNAIPLKLYYDHNFDPTSGFGTLNLWPGPALNYQLELFTWQQLQSFANLSTAYSFPPGYAKAIHKNLAVEIAPMARRHYETSADFEEVKEQARLAKAEVQSYNAASPILVCDAAFQGEHGGGVFNYMTGDTRR